MNVHEEMLRYFVYVIDNVIYSVSTGEGMMSGMINDYVHIY